MGYRDALSWIMYMKCKSATLESDSSPKAVTVDLIGPDRFNIMKCHGR
jgi:hypothetical protein